MDGRGTAAELAPRRPHQQAADGGHPPQEEVAAKAQYGRKAGVCSATAEPADVEWASIAMPELPKRALEKIVNKAKEDEDKAEQSSESSGGKAGGKGARQSLPAARGPCSAGCGTNHRACSPPASSLRAAGYIPGRRPAGSQRAGPVAAVAAPPGPEMGKGSAAEVRRGLAC